MSPSAQYKGTERAVCDAVVRMEDASNSKRKNSLDVLTESVTTVRVPVSRVPGVARGAGGGRDGSGSG